MTQRFMIEVVTRFKNENLDGVIRQAEAGLRDLEARAGSFNPKTAQEALSEHRKELERGVAHGLATGELTPQQAGTIRAGLTKFFDQLTKDLAKFAPEFFKKIDKAIEQGHPKPPQPALRDVVKKETPGLSISRARYEAAELERRALPKPGKSQAAIDTTYDARRTAMLAGDKEYIRATALLARARSELARAESAAKLNPKNVEAQAARRQADERLRRANDFAYLEKQTPGDAKGKAQTTALREKVARQEALATEQLRLDKQVIDETAQLAALRQKRSIVEERATLQATKGNIAAQAHLDVDKQRRATAQGLAKQQVLAAQPELQADEAKLAAAVKRRAAEVTRLTQEELANDERYIQSTARAAEARRHQATLLAAHREGVATKGVDSAELRVQTQVARQARTAKERADVNERMLKNEHGELDAIVHRQATERRLNSEIERRVREENRVANGGQGLLPGGTAFQRAQALLHSKRTGEPGDPGAFQTGTQFLGSKALTTAGYAASGAILYGGLQTLKDIVKETEKLQLVSIAAKSTFEAIGQGEQFQGFRTEMLAISRETGVAADQVLNVGVQLKAAFGDDTKRAVKETKAAIKASVVSGIDQKELTDSLTAAAISYKTGIEQISDESIAIFEDFGVNASETLKVLGDIAPVAAEAGLSLHEVGSIIGDIQKRSGRSGTAIAEGLGRVFASLSQSTSKVLALYRSVPALASKVPTITNLIATGQTGKELLQLRRDRDKFTPGQLQDIKSALGGRKEAPLLDPFFSGKGAGEIIDRIDNPKSTGGKTEARFEQIQKSLSQTLKRIGNEFHQLGVALADAGLLDAFALLFIGIEKGLGVLGFFVRLLASINHLTGGVAGGILAIAVALKSVSLALKAIEGARVATGLLKGIFGGAGAVGAGAGASVLTAESKRALEGSAVRRGVGGRVSGFLIPQLDFSKMKEGLASARAAIGAFALRLKTFVVETIAEAQALAAAHGIGAAEVGAVGLAGAAVVGVGVALVHQRTNARQASDKFRADLQKADQAKLNAEIEKRKSFFTSLGDDFDKLVFGRSVGDDLKGEENRRQKPGLTARLEAGKTGKVFSKAQIKTALDKGIKRGFFDLHGYSQKRQQDRFDTIDEIIKGVEAGDKQANAVADALLKQTFGNDEDTAKLIAAQKKQADGKKQQKKSKISRIRTAEDYERDFQAGKVAYPELIKQLQAEASALEAADRGTAEDWAGIVAAREKVRTAISASITEQVQIVQQLQQLAGVDAKGQLPNLEAGLGLIKNDPAALKSLADQAANTQSQAYQDAITNASSAEEALSLAENKQPLDPATAKAYHDWQMERFHKIVFPDPQIGATEAQKKQIRQQLLQQRIAQLHAQEGAELTPEATAAQALRDANLTFDQATNDQQRADATIAANAARKQAHDVELDKAKAVLERHKAETQDPAERAQDDLKLANDELAEAKRLGDPARIDRAKGAVATANQAVQAVKDDIARANIELIKASNPNNALAQAQAQQREADQAAAEAHGVAAQVRAQALKIQADKAVADAIFDLGTAQNDLLRAMMERSGDSVGIAQLNVTDAQRELDRVRADPNAGQKEIQVAENALLRAQTAAGDAMLQHTLELIDFDQTMGTATKDQVYARLKGALALADSEQEVRDILTKMHAIEADASKDLQFDLPSNLNLPTLYEARRLNQSAPGGYQDNRQIAVTLQVTPETYEQAFADTQALVSDTPQRFAGGRLY